MCMGMLSRALIPRSVRRAAHPVRTVKKAVTPKPIKQVRRAMNPVSNAKYSVERSLMTPPRVRSTRPTYTHPGCNVQHRTPEAAAKCRTGRPASAPTTRARAQAGPSAAPAPLPPFNSPQPPAIPVRPHWRDHLPQLTAAIGGPQVSLAYKVSADNVITVTVQILSVDGWTCMARNHALHRIDEYDSARSSESCRSQVISIFCVAATQEEGSLEPSARSVRGDRRAYIDR